MFGILIWVLVQDMLAVLAAGSTQSNRATAAGKLQGHLLRLLRNK
jgi:hypothetical protein